MQSTLSLPQETRRSSNDVRAYVRRFRSSFIALSKALGQLFRRESSRALEVFVLT